MSQASGPGPDEDVVDVVKGVDECVVEETTVVVDEVVEEETTVVVDEAVVEAVDVVVSSVIVVVVVEAVVEVGTSQEKSSGCWGFHRPSSLHQMSPWASPPQ